MKALYLRIGCCSVLSSSEMTGSTSSLQAMPRQCLAIHAPQHTMKHRATAVARCLPDCRHDAHLSSKSNAIDCIFHALYSLEMPLTRLLLRPQNLLRCAEALVESHFDRSNLQAKIRYVTPTCDILQCKTRSDDGPPNRLILRQNTIESSQYCPTPTPI